PPVANPASKGPLLTLFKQARAFGVGVCLATQNPVDLDYKALSNAGTWLIGRLQTDRDRARLLDGLEGAAGGALDRASAEAAIAGLGKRRFLVHNVHAKAPVEIESRWCLSYLRGPMTRDDLKRLRSAGADDVRRSRASARDAEARVETRALQAHEPPAADAAAARPLLPPDIPQFFDEGGGPASVWTPFMYGAAQVAFSDAKRRIDETKAIAVVVPLAPDAVVVGWDAGAPTDRLPQHLATDPPDAGTFAALPPQAQQVKMFAKWAKDLDRWVGRTQRLQLLRHAGLGLISAPGEDERAFRIRLASAARESRDGAVDKIRAKYASKLRAATERVRKMEMALGKEQQDVSQHKVQTGLSAASTVGSAVLGALFGRRGGLTAGTIGKASTAAKGWARGSKEAGDVARATQNLAAARQAVTDLEGEVAAAVAAVDTSMTAADPLETLAIAPRRGGISVQVVGLLWRPSAP
ncbi:MAG: ATP-binding protein, partial [Acidobacteria bacterium]|nr:ATP-binding protein [Acidobacteriota bacterium]